MIVRHNNADHDWTLQVTRCHDHGRKWNVSATSMMAGTCQWTVDSNMDDGDASRPRWQWLELPGDRLTQTRMSLYGKRTSDGWLTTSGVHQFIRLTRPPDNDRQTNSSEWQSDHPATGFVASATDWRLCCLSWDALTNDVSLQQRSDSICLGKFAHEADRNSVEITRSENCQTSGDRQQLNWLETITRRQVWNTLIARASHRQQDWDHWRTVNLGHIQHIHGKCKTMPNYSMYRQRLAITIGPRFESCLGTIAQWPWSSYLHLCASVTKQYNLVPVEGQWHSQTGKLMHWPRVTALALSVVYPVTHSKPIRRRWTLAYALITPHYLT